jgi:hypothetical protein
MVPKMDQTTTSTPESELKAADFAIQTEHAAIRKDETIEEENGDVGLESQGLESEERVAKAVDWGTLISSFLKRRDG